MLDNLKRIFVRPLVYVLSGLFVCFLMTFSIFAVCRGVKFTEVDVTTTIAYLIETILISAGVISVVIALIRKKKAIAVVVTTLLIGYFIIDEAISAYDSIRTAVNMFGATLPTDHIVRGVRLCFSAAGSIALVVGLILAIISGYVLKTKSEAVTIVSFWFLIASFAFQVVTCFMYAGYKGAFDQGAWEIFFDIAYALLPLVLLGLEISAHNLKKAE